MDTPKFLNYITNISSDIYIPPEEIENILKCDKESSESFLSDAQKHFALFGDRKVYLSGIIELSRIYEKNSFVKSFYRQGIIQENYCMSSEEIISAARDIINSGIKNIILIAQNDPFYNRDMLSYIIYSIKQISDVSITLSLGERNPEDYKTWKYSGADRYLIYNTDCADEGKNRGFNFSMNWRKHLALLKSIGYEIGAGIILTDSESKIKNIAETILFAKEIGCDSFVINPHSSVVRKSNAEEFSLLTLKTIAIAKIVLKNVFLPAVISLDTLMERGIEKALEAGANVIMPDYTPEPYRADLYDYFNGQCKYNDPTRCLACLRSRIEALGRTIENGKVESVNREIRNHS